MHHELISCNERPANNKSMKTDAIVAAFCIRSDGEAANRLLQTALNACLDEASGGRQRIALAERVVERNPGSSSATKTKASKKRQTLGTKSTLVRFFSDFLPSIFCQKFFSSMIRQTRTDGMLLCERANRCAIFRNPMERLCNSAYLSGTDKATFWRDVPTKFGLHS